MLKSIKFIYKEFTEILQLSNVHISSKRKFLIYFQLLTVILLIISQYFYPIKWIQFGIFPAILELTLFYLSISFIVNIIRVFFVSVYRKNNKFAADYYDNLIIAIDNLTSLTINIIFLFLLFYLLGVEMKSFFTSIALFAVALTILFKEIITNFINGVKIMFSRNIKLREYIAIDDYKGKIVNITLQNVELKNDDGDIIFIPNSIFSNKETINYSKSNIKKIKYHFLLDNRYISEVEKLETYMVSKLSGEFESLKNPEIIFLKIKTITKDGVELCLEINVTKYNFKMEEKVLRFCSYEILKFIAKLNSKEEKSLLKVL